MPFNKKIESSGGVSPEDRKKGRLKSLFRYLFLPTAFFLLPLNFIIQYVPVASGSPEKLWANPVTLDMEIRKNDTFYTVLDAFKVAPAEIGRIIKEAASFYDLRRLREGDVISITRAGGDIQRIEYRHDYSEGLFIERDPGKEGGFKSGRFELPSTVEETIGRGTIENSFYEAGLNAGINPGVIMELSDIFAWDVDFATGIRRGDTFRILYEIVYVEGRPVRTGRILGAEIVNDGQRYLAVYYEDHNGRADYYDENGGSLRRTLLKSPLRYRRISSYFRRNRFHPILKRYRPHHGIDYAAPAGTPVEAAGGGRVVFAGWKAGYGNFVEIRHNDVYTTAYGHLRSIKKGVRAGSRIGQGEVVGYVGSTGLSTGPHLHYEIKRRGALINPLSIKPEPGRRLDKKEMPVFTALKGEITARLAGSLPEKETAVAMEKVEEDTARR